MKKNSLFQQKLKGRFVVHIYYYIGGAQEYFYDNQLLARKFAHLCFAESVDCYKVKVWDTVKGPILPNVAKITRFDLPDPEQKSIFTVRIKFVRN